MFKSGGRIFSRARPAHEPKKTVIGQCVPKAVARNWPRLPATRYLALFLYVISCSKLAAKKKRTGRRNTSEQPNEFLSLFTVLYDAEEQRAAEMNGDGRTKGKRELHRYEFEHTKATDTGLDTSQLPLCRSSFMVHRCKKRVKLPRTYTEALKVSLLRGLPLLYECKMSFVCCSLKFGLSRATLPHRLPWKLVCILAMSFVLLFSRVLHYFASGSIVTVKMVVDESDDEQENSGWVCLFICVCTRARMCTTQTLECLNVWILLSRLVRQRTPLRERHELHWFLARRSDPPPSTTS